MSIELTTEELHLLWALCMSDLSDEVRPLAKRLTEAMKENKNG